MYDIDTLRIATEFQDDVCYRDDAQKQPSTNSLVQLNLTGCLVSDDIRIGECLCQHDEGN